MKSIISCLLLLILSGISNYAFASNYEALNYQMISDYKLLRTDPEAAIIKPEKEWEELCLMHNATYDFSLFKEDKYNKDFLKAMRLMQTGNAEKALEIMEMIALGKKCISYQDKSHYQLFFYQHFGTFDFKTDYRTKFDHRIIDIAGIERDYYLNSSKVRKKTHRTHFELKFPISAIRALLPVIGFQQYDSNRAYFLNQHATLKEAQIEHASLYEYYLRKKSGKVYPNEKIEHPCIYTLYSKSDTDGAPVGLILRCLQVLPYCVGVKNMEYNTYRLMQMGEDILANQDLDYFYKNAFSYFLTAAAMGEPKAIGKLLELISKAYPFNTESTTQNRKNCEIYIKTIQGLNNEPLFAAYRPLFADITSNANELCTIYRNMEAKEKKAAEAAELALRRAEQERKAQEKARRQEMWANIGMGLLQGAAQFVNSMSQPTYTYVPSPQYPQTSTTGVPDFLRPEVFVDNYMNGRPTMPSASELGFSGMSGYAYDVQRNVQMQIQQTDYNMMQQTQQIIEQASANAQKEIQNFEKIYGRTPTSEEINAIYARYNQIMGDATNAYGTYVEETTANNSASIGSGSRTSNTKNSSNNSSTTASTKNTTKRNKTQNTTSSYSANVQDTPSTNKSDSSHGIYTQRKVNVYYDKSTVAFYACEVYQKGSTLYLKVHNDFYVIQKCNKQYFNHFIRYGHRECFLNL